VPDGCRGDGKEVCARFKVGPPLLDELQVRFVDERCRVEHPACIPSTSLPMREHAQLFVDHGIQLVQRRPIAGAYRIEQASERFV
jgi:hypothetical protein